MLRKQRADLHRQRAVERDGLSQYLSGRSVHGSLRPWQPAVLRERPAGMRFDWAMDEPVPLSLCVQRGHLHGELRARDQAVQREDSAKLQRLRPSLAGNPPGMSICPTPRSRGTRRVPGMRAQRHLDREPRRQRRAPHQLCDMAPGPGLLHLGWWLPPQRGRVALRGFRWQRAARLPLGVARHQHGGRFHLCLVRLHGRRFGFVHRGRLATTWHETEGAGQVGAARHGRERQRVGARPLRKLSTGPVLELRFIEHGDVPARHPRRLVEGRRYVQLALRRAEILGAMARSDAIGFRCARAPQ